MDCLVIGCGLIGSSIAWRLAQAGARVTMLEARRFYGQASWAGAGMLSPGGERFPSELWRQRAIESLRMYPAFVEELARESGDPIDYSACNAVEIGEGGEVRSAGEALVNPRDLGAALRTVLRDQGVRLLSYQPALHILRQGGAWQVGELKAQVVVVAAGAWSGGLTVEGSSLPATVPVKGFLLGYSMKAGSLTEIRRAGHTYVLQRRDGFTVAGSTEQRVGFDESMDAALVRDLHERAASVWTPLASRTPDRVWMGFRPATETGEIYVEPLGGDESCWLAYGHFRNGILLAPWTSAHVASRVLAGDRASALAV